MLPIVQNHESILHVHWWEEVLLIITQRGANVAECTPGAHVGQMQNSHSLMQLFRRDLHTVVSESGRTWVEHSSPPMTVGILHVFCMMENIDR